MNETKLETRKVRIFKVSKIDDMYVISILCPECDTQFDIPIILGLSYMIGFPCQLCRIYLECDSDVVRKSLMFIKP